MIDINTEHLYPLREIDIPGDPHVATRYRWAQAGVRGIKLEVARIGSKLFSSTEAVERFTSRLTNGPDAPTGRTPKERDRAHRDRNPAGFGELLLAAKALTDMARKAGVFRDATERAMKAIANVGGE